MSVGSIVGGFIPGIWGGSYFSFEGLFCSGIVALFGIFAGYKLGQMI